MVKNSTDVGLDVNRLRSIPVGHIIHAMHATGSMTQDEIDIVWPSASAVAGLPGFRVLHRNPFLPLLTTAAPRLALLSRVPSNVSEQPPLRRILATEKEKTTAALLAARAESLWCQGLLSALEPLRDDRWSDEESKGQRQVKAAIVTLETELGRGHKLCKEVPCLLFLCSDHTYWPWA